MKNKGINERRGVEADSDNGVKEPKRSDQGQRLIVFFDGDCPLCKREIAFIQRKAKPDALGFVDISASDFKAEEFGKEKDELMRAIHARTEDGEWVTGVDVFRGIYSRLGFKRLSSFSRFPVVSHLLGVSYRIFAWFRYRAAVRRMQNNACAEQCSVSENSMLDTQKGV